MQEPTVRTVEDLVLGGPAWTRGRARIDAGWVVLEELTEYRSACPAEAAHPMQFVAISTDSEMVDFASRFGLLRQRAAAGDVVLREPIKDWLREVMVMRTAALQGALLRQFGAGDDSALERLRGTFPGSENFDAVRLVSGVSMFVGTCLDEGQDAVRQIADIKTAYGGEIGIFPRLTEARTLRSWLWLRLHILLSERGTIRSCSGCDTLFSPADSRQRYCTPECSNRARQRRHLERLREA
jgi:hypothetical protein